MIEATIIKRLVEQRGQVGELERREQADTIGASYAQSSGQTIPSGSNTPVLFNTLIDDDDSLVAVGLGWLFTCAVAGRYHIEARIEFQGSTAWALGEVAILEVYKNSGATIRALHRRDDMSSAATAQAMDLHGSTTLRLAVGDTLYISLYQASGASINLATSAARNYVDIYRWP